MKLLSILFIAFSLSATAFANGGVAKSEFTWKAEKKLPGKGHHGNITLKSSSLEVNKDGMIEKGEFVMDMTSMTVTDLKGEWAEKFLKHIKSEDFFEITKYPTAKLELMKQTKKGEVEGKLTLKDKTNPITVTFTNDGREYKGTLTFDRTKWGVIYGSGNFFKELTADKIIKNEVNLEFMVVAK